MAAAREQGSGPDGGGEEAGSHATRHMPHATRDCTSTVARARRMGSPRAPLTLTLTLTLTVTPASASSAGAGADAAAEGGLPAPAAEAADAAGTPLPAVAAP